MRTTVSIALLNNHQRHGQERSHAMSVIKMYGYEAAQANGVSDQEVGD